MCEPIKTHLHRFSHCEWTAHKPLTLYSNMASASARGDPTCLKEDCSRFDVWLICGSTARFSYAEKFEFIQNVWRPGLQFKLPQCDHRELGKLRKFRQDWLIRFPWLVYSKYLDVAFCLPCISFGVEYGTKAAAFDRWLRKQLTFWASACVKF